MSAVFTVREITGHIKNLLEGEFPFVWVRGQVTNLSRPASGHVYFTLKDEDATLSAVWFKRSRMRRESGVDPLTGEVLANVPGMLPGMLPSAPGREDPASSLADGQEILCGGQITVYPPRGSYQLRVELVEDMGVGRLHQEFEALKQRFAGLGYFDQARKRPLPRHPVRVAVITASTGAAIRDFLRLAGERGFGAHVRVYPTLVQGEQAGEQIAEALRLAEEQGWAQVKVLIRGGGSLEDLWAFNTEPVAKAVFESKLPVLAGIGHEVDVTIADMVADVRAATPSHAAQLLWPERGVLEQEVDGLDGALARSMQRCLLRSGDRLAGLERALRLLSPLGALGVLAERFEAGGQRLNRAARALLGRGTEQALGLQRRLARAFGPQTVERAAQDVDALERTLARAGERKQRQAEQELDSLAARLAALNPEAPLARGFSLVRVRATGELLRDAAQVEPGSALDISPAQGRVAAQVTDVADSK